MQKLFKNWKFKPHERENGGIPPQLQRIDSRWKGLLSKIKTRLVHRRGKVCFRAQASNDAGTWLNTVAPRIRCASYRPGQIKQSSGKFSSSLEDCSSEDTPIFSHIREIKYVGVKRVYDLEVAEEHTYLANGIFVHNSNPNLTNLPSGSKYGKLIKSCFQAPEGWLFVGLDFAALEAKINALLTRDPEKMKIYLEGYDSHCLNTFTYWPELMPDIKQAEESDECFECTSKDGKETIYFKGTDIVTYKGTSYRGTELFALLTSEGL